MLKFDKKKQLGKVGIEEDSKKFVSTESILQEQCEDYLEALGLAFIRIPDKVYESLFSYGSRLPIYVKRNMSKYLKGLPDLTVFFDSGKYVCVELKAKKGKVSGGQKKWCRAVGKKNYYVIRSFEGFQALINGYRLTD